MMYMVCKDIDKKNDYTSVMEVTKVLFFIAIMVYTVFKLS